MKEINIIISTVCTILPMLICTFQVLCEHRELIMHVDTTSVGFVQLLPFFLNTCLVRIATWVKLTRHNKKKSNLCQFNVCVCLRCARDVHVIEITRSRDATSRGGGALRVIVRAETRRRRHVVLLLRVHDHVTSYIQTESLRGTLDIVVSLSLSLCDHCVVSDCSRCPRCWMTDTLAARWCSGRVSDSRWADCGFDSRLRHCRATTLGKLFTPMCLCLPSSIIWYLARAFVSTRRLWQPWHEVQ